MSATEFTPWLYLRAGQPEMHKMKSLVDTRSDRVPIISYMNLLCFSLYLVMSTIRYVQLGFKQDLQFLYFYSSFMLMAIFCMYKLEQIGFSASEKGLKTAYVVLSLVFFLMMFYDAIQKREGCELVLLAGFSAFSIVLLACGSCWYLILNDV